MLIIRIISCSKRSGFTAKKMFGRVRQVALAMAGKWKGVVNNHGGDVTLVQFPEIGLRGNTHFPMADLNNLEVADHLLKWLMEKGMAK